MTEPTQDPAELARRAGTDADGGTAVTSARREANRETAIGAGAPEQLPEPDVAVQKTDGNAAASPDDADAQRGPTFLDADDEDPTDPDGATS